MLVHTLFLTVCALALTPLDDPTGTSAFDSVRRKVFFSAAPNQHLVLGNTRVDMLLSTLELETNLAELLEHTEDAICKSKNVTASQKSLSGTAQDDHLVFELVCRPAVLFFSDGGLQGLQI